MIRSVSPIMDIHSQSNLRKVNENGNLPLFQTANGNKAFKHRFNAAQLKEDLALIVKTDKYERSPFILHWKFTYIVYYWITSVAIT